MPDERPPFERSLGPPPDVPGGSKRIDEERLAGRMGDVVSAGLPLAAGLRVMAEEMRGRDRRGLLAICERLEAGDPPDRALETAGAGVSPHLVGIVRAGMRSGDLGLLLTQYVERNRDRSDRRRRVLTSLAYPVVLMTITLVLLGFLLVWIVPGFRTIFEDFGTELPGLTEFVVAASNVLTRYPVEIAVGLFGVVALVVLLIAVPSGRVLLRKCLDLVPVVGPIVRFNGLASFCDLLGLIVSQSVPLPEALRMTASAVDDPELSRAARRMAEDVEHGENLADGRRTRQLPPGLQQAFLWSNDVTAFGDSLTAAARIYDARARVNGDLLNALLAPVVIVTLAFTVGMVVIALFLPLIKLLNDLS